MKDRKISFEEIHDRAVVRCNKLSVPILRNITVLFEHGYEIVLYTVAYSVHSLDKPPCPYNARIEIKDDDQGVEHLIIEGTLRPDGLGYCKVMVPLAEATMYALEIQSSKDNLPDWLKKL